VGGERQLTNVAAGTQDTDAVNLGQFNAALEDVDADLAGAVKYDDEDKAKLTLAGEGGTTIANVAPGLLSATSTEAVNGAQLFGMGDSMAQFLGGGAAMGANGFSGPTYLIQGGNYYSVGDALGALDGAISGIDSRLGALEAGTSNATAGATPATAASGAGQVDDRVAGGEPQSGSSRNTGTTGTPSPTGPSTGGQSAPVAQAPAPAPVDQETLDSANAYTDTTATKTLASANSYTDTKFNALDDRFQQLSDNLGARLNQQ